MVPGGGAWPWGGAWSQGVHGPTGCMVPGGCAWSSGVCMVPGGCTVPGGCMVLGGLGAWYRDGGGGIPACTKADPPVNRMTNRCKNITLRQTSFAAGNNPFNYKYFVTEFNGFSKTFRGNSNKINLSREGNPKIWNLHTCRLRMPIPP